MHSYQPQNRKSLRVKNSLLLSDRVMWFCTSVPSRMGIRRPLHLRGSRVVKDLIAMMHAAEILAQTRCSVKVSLPSASLPYSIFPILRLHPIASLPVTQAVPQGQWARGRHGAGHTLDSRRQSSGPLEAQK